MPKCFTVNVDRPIPEAVLFKARVFVSFIARIAGSNPAEGMDVRLLCLLCVVKVMVSAMG